MKKVLQRAACCLGAIFAVVGCGEGSEPDEGPLGSATLLLAEVPDDVRCLKVTAEGSRTETRSFDLTPGESSVLRFGGLPVGDVTFVGQAYAAACNEVTPSMTASFLSDPTTVAILSTAVAEVRLFLKRNAQGDLIVDFEGDGSQCTVVNAALTASVSESDPGWGGGSFPEEINDGLTCYPDWPHGLAFTGGPKGWAGQPCGWRQATLDFGAERTLLSPVTVHHHGADHTPEQVRIEVFRDGAWHEVFATDNGKSLMLPDTCPVGSTPVEHDIGTVNASKLRYSLNNCGMPGDGHGWLYEVITPACK